MSKPHEVDPVYQAVKKDSEVAKQDVDKFQEEVDHLNTEYAKSAEENEDRREIVDALTEQNGKLERAKEKYLYLQQKMKQIIKDDAIKYKEAFKNDKPWPNPEDFEVYQLKKSLDETKGKEWLPERRIKKLLGKKPAAPPPPSE